MARETFIWLIRHAPVRGAPGVIHDSEAPADLSDTAALAGVRALLPTRSAAYCSPSRRTTQTAAALGLVALPDARLREQDFGGWTGRTHAELSRTEGPQYEAFWLAPARCRPPGGESFAEQITRVAAAIDDLPAGNAVLVVHAGTIRAALALVLDLAPDAALRFVIDPLSVTRIDRLIGGWRVIGINRAQPAT